MRVAHFSEGCNLVNKKRCHYKQSLDGFMLCRSSSNQSSRLLESNKSVVIYLSPRKVIYTRPPGPRTPGIGPCGTDDDGVERLGPSTEEGDGATGVEGVPATYGDGVSVGSP